MHNVLGLRQKFDKARADVKRWQRKARLAQTKLKKAHAHVARYEKLLIAERKLMQVVAAERVT